MNTNRKKWAQHERTAQQRNFIIKGSLIIISYAKKFLFIDVLFVVVVVLPFKCTYLFLDYVLSEWKPIRSWTKKDDTNTQQVSNVSGAVSSSNVDEQHDENKTLVSQKKCVMKIWWSSIHRFSNRGGVWFNGKKESDGATKTERREIIFRVLQK